MLCLSDLVPEHRYGVDGRESDASVISRGSPVSARQRSAMEPYRQQHHCGTDQQ